MKISRKEPTCYKKSDNLFVIDLKIFEKESFRSRLKKTVIET